MPDSKGVFVIPDDILSNAGGVSTSAILNELQDTPGRSGAKAK